MITARALVEGNAKTLRLAEFAPDEKPRSLQLYGVDPRIVGEAVALARRRRPRRPHRHELRLPGAQGDAPRRRRRDPAAAAPARARSCARRSRTRARVPVTIKFRIGVDDAVTRPTSTPAASPRTRAAPPSRCTRAPPRSSTTATRAGRRSRELKRAVTRIPVLGNGDIWEAWDALRMMRATGCDGVVVGRGCLGRPWLFRELAQRVRRPRARGAAGARRRSCGILLEHAELLVQPGRRARGHAQLPQARHLVHEGLPRRRAPARRAGRSGVARAARRRSRASSRATTRFPLRRCAWRAASTPAASASRCPRASWRSATTPTPPGREAEDAESGG